MDEGYFLELAYIKKLLLLLLVYLIVYQNTLKVPHRTGHSCFLLTKNRKALKVKPLTSKKVSKPGSKMVSNSPEASRP